MNLGSGSSQRRVLTGLADHWKRWCDFDARKTRKERNLERKKRVIESGLFVCRLISFEVQGLKTALNGFIFLIDLQCSASFSLSASYSFSGEEKREAELTCQ